LVAVRAVGGPASEGVGGRRTRRRGSDDGVEARRREEEEDTRWRWGRARVAKEAELEAAGHLARVGS